jgi:hypothetical protein
MAYTSALIDIEEVVSRFLFKYKHGLEDAPLYVEHACDCVQHFSLYDGNQLATEKVTVNPTLFCIDMPSDMLSFIDLVTPVHGGWWSFSEKKQIVNTTTFTGLVEGRDSAQGEAVTIDQPRVTSYGAKGAWNKFRYTLDWVARRIYVDQTYDAADYIVLMYVSSGIQATGQTTVPAFVIPLIDKYLLLKETFWMPELARERQLREVDYGRERMEVRSLLNSMTYDQWRDCILISSTQTSQR